MTYIFYQIENFVASDRLEEHRKGLLLMYPLKIGAFPLIYFTTKLEQANEIYFSKCRFDHLKFMIQHTTSLVISSSKASSGHIVINIILRRNYESDFLTFT
jgi:hypothetical protein